MQELFEEIIVRSKLLRETAALASRRATRSDAEVIVEKIIANCLKGSFRIAKRDKNKYFMSQIGMDTKAINKWLAHNLRPEQLVCPMMNRNSSYDEVYLFTFKINGAWCYFKVSNDCSTAISFHDSNQKIYPDFRDSDDDMGFVIDCGKDWERRFNNNQSPYKIEYIDDVDSPGHTADYAVFKTTPGYDLNEVAGLMRKSMPRDRDLKWDLMNNQYNPERGFILMHILKKAD